MEKIPICTLKNIEKYYNTGSNILGPLSLSINSGEILGLRGHNGAGKSTLLKILAGVEKPNKGQYIHNIELDGLISYVPQDIALYTTLSAIDNLNFWGTVYGLPRKVRKTRSNWLLQQMELSTKANDKVSTYSGGMCRRLHLATALMITPKLLLLDEPTVGADFHSVEIILSLLQNLKQRGCAIVFVSHQSGELEKVCDRIIKLENGRIIDWGEAQ